MARPVVVDLHTHYPMHILAEEPVLPAARAPRTSWSPKERLQRAVLRRANDVANFPARGQPAVTGKSLAGSSVRVALSVLYVPFDEMDLSVQYASPPEGHYFADLRTLLHRVNSKVTTEDAVHAGVARTRPEIDSINQAGRVAIVHAVEGGFHLGLESELAANVAELARAGVACITIAHLFWRKVATNAPSLPRLSDAAYACLFPQPDTGLSSYGKALIVEMVRNGVLVDVAHMSPTAISETFALVDQLDPAGAVPVVSTHGGCRAVRNASRNLADEDIARIIRRNGVIGLMAGSRLMQPEGAQTTSFEETTQVLFSHLDHIESIARQAVAAMMRRIGQPEDIAFAGARDMAMQCVEGLAQQIQGDIGKSFPASVAGWKSGPSRPPCVNRWSDCGTAANGPSSSAWSCY